MRRYGWLGLGLCLVIGLTGCDNKPTSDNPSPNVSSKVDDVSGMSKEEVLDKYISNLDGIKSDELLALCNTLGTTTYNEQLEVENNPTMDALVVVWQDGTVVEPVKFINAALDSDNPLIRKVGIDIFDDYETICLEDADCMERVNKEIAEEKDPYVLQAIFEKNADKIDELPGLRERAIAEMKNPTPQVRAATEYIVINTQDDADKPYLLDYLNDESPIVQLRAIQDIAAYRDDSLVEYVESFLNNQDYASDHWLALITLMEMSMDAPFYDAKSSVAWQAIMNYFDQEYTDQTPSHNDVKVFIPADDKDEKFINWRDTTEYVDKTAIVQAMYRVVQSDVVNWLAANEAISVVKIYGTPEQYQALEQMIKERTNESMKDSLLDTYQEQLAKES